MISFFLFKKTVENFTKIGGGGYNLTRIGIIGCEVYYEQSSKAIYIDFGNVYGNTSFCERISFFRKHCWKN